MILSLSDVAAERIAEINPEAPVRTYQIFFVPSVIGLIISL